MMPFLITARSAIKRTTRKTTTTKNSKTKILGQKLTNNLRKLQTICENTNF